MLIKPISKRTSKPAGFTLIEVMAALAVLSITVVSILVIRGKNSHIVAESVNERIIGMLARQKLIDLATRRDTFGETDETRGTLEEYGHKEVTWQVAITPEAIPPLDPDESASIGTLYRITLTLHYESLGRPKTFKLVTYRPQSAFEERAP